MYCLLFDLIVMIYFLIDCRPGRQMTGDFSNLPSQAEKREVTFKVGRAGKREISFPTSGLGWAKKIKKEDK